MSKVAINGSFVVDMPGGRFSYPEHSLRAFITRAVTENIPQIDGRMPMGVRLESFAAHTIVPIEEEK